MNSPVLSPCVGICTVDPDGYCEGCFRSLHEIGNWLSFSHEQRELLMDTVLPERQQKR
jgi:uncharacterized protein